MAQISQINEDNESQIQESWRTERRKNARENTHIHIPIKMMHPTWEPRNM